MRKSSKTSVGCGHASCGAKCGVGKGQSAKPDNEKSEVQHERKEMGLIKKLEKMHPAKMLGKGQSTKGEPCVPLEGKRNDPAPPRSKSLVGRGQSRKVGRGSDVSGGNAQDQTTRKDYELDDDGHVLTRQVPNANQRDDWRFERKPASVGSGQGRKVGKGQAPGQPVIPGIQQPGGAPPKVDFGEPMMAPYTSGTPRSTRQGPYNMQGQGPPMGKGGKKPRIPKSGPVVHPGKRGKMGA